MARAAIGGAIAVALAMAPSRAAAMSIKLSVDAREAPRRIIHARLVIPARPGPLTLLYPKWIPGEHGPTGPIGSIAGLAIEAAGHALPWRRDPIDMYEFHCDVPEGAATVTVNLDFLVPASLEGTVGAASATSRLAIVNWNDVLLYPEDVPAGELTYEAELRLPPAWRHASALEERRGEDEGTLAFAPASLSTLIDSPVLAGVHFRSIPLGPDVELDLAADSDEALAAPEEWIGALRSLVREATALFGGAHFRRYRFLVALSDHVAHFGLEHHESSDNRLPERALIEEDTRRYWERQLPHEFVHSWNGKYRRPAAQLTSDYQHARHTGLLWVYEGLTAWLGDVLTVRSGLWSPDLLRGRLAVFASGLEHEPGRAWRSLADTAVAAQIARGEGSEWIARRRRKDYYTEGELLWLEIDTMLRQRSGGRRSLDDFCRRFFGGSGGPEVKSYTLDELALALADVAPFDWESFFAARVDLPAHASPAAGLLTAGWRLTVGDEPGPFQRLADELTDSYDFRNSLGATLDEDGAIVDVVPATPADRAGLAPGAVLVAVDRRRFSLARLRAAIAGTAAAPREVALLVEKDGYFEEPRVALAGGLRYPVLVREAARPDLLGAILAGRAGARGR